MRRDPRGKLSTLGRIRAGQELADERDGVSLRGLEG